VVVPSAAHHSPLLAPIIQRTLIVDEHRLQLLVGHLPAKHKLFERFCPPENHELGTRCGLCWRRYGQVTSISTGFFRTCDLFVRSTAVPVIR
jgi:hypothetical protein